MSKIVATTDVLLREQRHEKGTSFEVVAVPDPVQVDPVQVDAATAAAWLRAEWAKPAEDAVAQGAVEQQP